MPPRAKSGAAVRAQSADAAGARSPSAVAAAAAAAPRVKAAVAPAPLGNGGPDAIDAAAPRVKPVDAAGAQRRRLRQVELLLEVSRRMAAYDTLDEILTALVDVTTEELGAERGTLFLNDAETNELFSRVAQGNIQREIRFMNHVGIAGHVFTTGEAVLIADAYADPRFNRAIDEQTGFVTRNILCVPIKTFKGEIIGVSQTLNKKRGKFTRGDLQLLEALTTQGTLALQSARFLESMHKVRRQEMEFIDVVSEVTADIKLGSLLQKVMGEATRLLNAERSTLFLNDEKSGELWSEVGQGLESLQIRLPNNAGIAGAVFTSGKTINIPYAYADLRFNPAFDKRTGYFTRSILCVPIVNKHGKTIGVTQVLNKRGGPFSNEDESRLRAFTAQISIALENAKLFADVQQMKNYNEAMLESMSNGVITLDGQEKIVTCNAAGLRILRTDSASILGKPAADFFSGANAWVLERLHHVEENQAAEHLMDAELVCGGDTLSVNFSVQPLLSMEKKRIGWMLMVEDISNEKRLRSTMSRYMDPGIADQMVANGAELLGGKNVPATVLFSDIRSFTSITETLGAQGTVALLNEYFTLMVDCIQREEGMLDKFIGDAIMAAFGIPVAHEDDADRAVRSAIAMMRALRTWNAARAGDGKPPVEIGIGLNTDQVVSGNIGSRKRMDYTIIGDGVNLAARLESACKQYGARILISEFTYRALRGTYRLRELDIVVVKGKTQPVAIYEVMDFHNDDSYPQLVDAMGLFRNGLAQYRRRSWAAAGQLFAEVLVLNPQDKAATLYIERCAHLAEYPPADDWDGTFVMESK